MKSEMETAELMVRQLQNELAQRAAEEEERLVKAKENAALLGDGGDGASAAETIALREEVAVVRHKNQKLLHHKILHRVLKAQTEKAFLQLREANSLLQLQLSEAEEVLIAKDAENRALMQRNEELERLILAMQVHGLLRRLHPQVGFPFPSPSLIATSSRPPAHRPGSHCRRASHCQNLTAPTTMSGARI